MHLFYHLSLLRILTFLSLWKPQGLKGNPVSAPIGVKRMGELDEKPFLAVAKRHRSSKSGADDAIKLASLWEERLGDPNWHPFKAVTIGGDSKVWGLLMCLYIAS